MYIHLFHVQCPDYDGVIIWWGGSVLDYVHLYINSAVQYWATGSVCHDYFVQLSTCMHACKFFFFFFAH